MPSLLNKSLVGILIGSCASLFSYWTLITYLNRRKYRHIPGPPTKGLYGFYFGNMSEVVNNVKNGGTYFDLLAQWIKQYGNVIKFQFMNRMVVATIDPDAVREILITKVFPKDPVVIKVVSFPFGERFLGVGLVSEPSYEKWRTKRGNLNPFFHKRSLVDFMGEFNLKGDILMEHLRPMADGKEMITLLKELNHITLEAIASIAFGMDIDAINDPKNDLNKSLINALTGMETLLYDPLITLKPHKWSEMKDMKIAIKKLRTLGREQILKRLKMKEENQELPNDMITLFLKEQNSSFEIEEMVDEFITFFFAGQETTANTLGFAILALGKYPPILKKLRQELEEVLGSRKEIKYEDLTNLKYTTCVIKETLRLWPIAAGLGRVTKGEFKIKEYNIPSETTIQVSSYISSRNEQFFENPLDFVPERWIQKVNVENHQNYACFPFSLGPRNCIGQNFAMMEAKIVLAKFISSFDFTLDQKQNFNPKETITLTPADGVRCILSLRDN